MIQRLFLVFFMLTMFGCTTPPPTYRYTSIDDNDPEITFDSNFSLHTFFSINTKVASNNRCSDFDSVGYILKRDSLLIYDKPNHSIHIRVRPNHAVTIRALHQFNDATYTSKCGPIFQQFTPLTGTKYRVDLFDRDKYCALSIRQLAEDGSWQQTPTTSMNDCR